MLFMAYLKDISDNVDPYSHENLARIKENISNSYLYFKKNYDRFRTYRTYVFKESVSDAQRALLRKLVRPTIEFNILEAYISRLLGEFAKHEPSIEVSPAEGVPVEEGVITTVEQHFRHILHKANKESFSYETYKDTLSGGFSVAKVWTDYATPMSFNQDINVSKAFDPTLCGFDPMARDSHKGDGSYCFEIFPMSDSDFHRTFPKVKLTDFTYAESIKGFQWSYKDLKDNRIILVADYYEKKKKKTKIVKLSDGLVMTAKTYKKMQEYWEEQQFIEQIPDVVSSRSTILETVCRYRMVENSILEYIETDYSYLPLVFFDGNSIVLTEGKMNASYQMTRPYIYHARGVQELKNYAGQSLANYLQSLIQSKFIIKKEAIPQEQDYKDAIKNIQRASHIVVNAYSENNPDKQIPDPIREIINAPAPPEVMAAFQITDPTTQTILGSFASNLGKNDNDLSGKAVIESASVGNSAAMPYVVGYLAGLTQVANICADLMPKYLMGPRQIPVVMKDGNKSYQEVNKNGKPKLDYEQNALRVNVEAGVNFQVQKNQAVEQIIALMRASEELGQFFNSEKGMKILARNLTIYGADNLEEAIDEFMVEQKKQKEQAMQMQQQAMQQDPRMMKAQADMKKIAIEEQELQLKAKEQEFNEQIQIAKMAIDKELADAKILEAKARISQDQIDSAIAIERAQTSLETHALDSATKIAEIHGRDRDRKIKEHESFGGNDSQ